MNAPVAPSRMNVPGPGNAASGNALELRGITKMFGALAAISDVTLSVKPGERRAVLGSNGAGKTTLFNCITGDFLPTAGFIRFFGEDVTVFPPHERIRRGLRRTYQISSLFTGLSVMDNVYLACRGVSRNRFSLIRPRADDALVHAAEMLIGAVHLTDEKHRLVGELAYGQQRQLEIALALSGRPDSSCSTNLLQDSRPPSEATSSASSPRCRATSDTSSSSMTWMSPCASSKASR